ncbi:hypothetical protein GL50803_0019381 [Giardia duodenalis]|uniref:Uncharacterized protein n=1 Tax=Giardia intestinalis (strain ATCC 50803 / WB clone C6) TaxID=184922 RepID=D3KG19_GIAIC|nr:hypothetical protein GL50803_0019381 [Giardia intestinalis]KAE8303083.1 hypothetical protein GL50803_0019381 [Giardia intestinalis]
MWVLVVLSILFWQHLAVGVTGGLAEASCSVDSLVWTCKGPGLLPLDLLQPDKVFGITHIHGDMFCESTRITGYDGLISLAGWNSYRQQAYLRVTETNAYYLTLDMKKWMALTSSIDVSAGSSRIQLGEGAVLQGYLHSLS